MDFIDSPLDRKIRHNEPVRFSQRGFRSVGGFSLLEVLVAVSIILGGILLLAQAWSGNYMRIRKSALNNNVAALLERKMAEVEAAYRDKPIAEIPDEDSGDFGPEFKQYRWTMRSQEFEMPDLSSVLVSTDQGDETLLTIIGQTQEYISKAVKEVTVSVFVKTASREVEFDVTTYFVDYQQELTLGGGGSGGDK